MSTTNWWAYVESHIEGMTMRDAAKKAGFDQSAFTRWKKGARPDPDFVIKFARAFNLNVLNALVQADVITAEEAGMGGESRFGTTIRSLEMGAAEAEALSRVLRDSLMSIQASYVFDTTGKRLNPHDFRDYEEIRRLFLEAVSEDKMPSTAPVDELANRRSNRSTPVSDPSDNHEYDGTVREFDWGIPHAADGSIEENEARMNRGEDLID